MGRDKVHPAPATDLETGKAGGIADNKFVETKVDGPLLRRSSSIKRFKSISANQDILKRFQVIELEEGMLVEYIKDVNKPNSKELCQIMLINDGEPPTYNLRVCSAENTIYENCSEREEVEMFKEGGVHKEVLVRITRYKTLPAGSHVQVFCRHPIEEKKNPECREAWYNGEILSSSGNEQSGVLYEVAVATPPKVKDVPSLQSITYSQIRRKPRPKFEQGDHVEVFVEQETKKNPFFPARVINVSTDTAAAGGIVYDVQYYPSGKLSGEFVTLREVSPFHIRDRFSGDSQQKSYAEFCLGAEGWLKCRVEKVNADGTYFVNVEDGEPEEVPATASDLRIYLAVGECAKRQRDGRPVTIVKMDKEEEGADEQNFEVDVHLEGEISREQLTRRDVEGITLEELQFFGIENAGGDSHLATKEQRDAILDKIEDVIIAKDNGPFVWSCHSIDTATGKSLHHSENVFAAAYSRDGAFFVTGDISGRIMLCEGHTGVVLDTNFYSYGGGSNPWIVNLVFSADDKMLAVCLLSGVVVLNLERREKDGADVLIRTGSPLVAADRHSGGCLTCDFSPVEAGLLASGGVDGTVVFWGVKPGSIRSLTSLLTTKVTCCRL
mgnify:FL=1